jgi:hypothetical protein
VGTVPDLAGGVDGRFLDAVDPPGAENVTAVTDDGQVADCHVAAVRNGVVV